MGDLLNTLQESYLVNYSDCDAHYEMTVSAMLNLFEDIVGRHTAQMQVDMNTILQKYGAKWVVTKIKVKIDKLPVNTTKIQVSTWPHKPGFVRFGRSGIFADDEGKTYVRFYSDWCILDAKSDKLLKSAALPSLIKGYREDRAIENSDIPEFKREEYKYVYSREMRYSDLDPNRHVNNVMFAKYAFDVFPLALYDEKITDYVEVEFVEQCYEGDKLDFYIANCGQNRYHILEKCGEKDVFRMNVCFKERN